VSRLRNSEPGGVAAIARKPALWTALVATVIVVATAWGAAPSLAANTPWWHLSTRMFPSNLAPGGEATVVLLAANVGDGPMQGTPAVKESFPVGITVKNVEFYPLLSQTNGKQDLSFLCTHSVNAAECALPSGLTIRSFEDLEIRVTVADEGFSGPAPTMEGEATGGEAPRAATTQRLPITTAPVTFGIEHFAMVPEEEGGGVDVQAGSHPYQLTSTLTLTEAADQTKPVAVARNVAIKLPPGLIGNATKIAQCSDADFKASVEPGSGIAGTVDRCSPAAMVGVAIVTIDEPDNVGLATLPVPIFNLVPEPGEPARFGFEIAQSPVVLDTSVRTGADYGVTVTTKNITELAAFISSVVTFWGVPGDERHDEARGWNCLIGGKWYIQAPPCAPEHETEPTPLLALPTACGLFAASAEGVSWPTKTAPEGLPIARSDYSLTDELGRELGLAGCGRLRFEPSLEVQPEVSRASAPSGLRVDLHMPEAANETAKGLVGSAIKDLSVSLPQGVAVNPSSAGGLESCAESAIGYLAGQSAPPSNLAFSATLPPGWEEGSGFCPTASKIGTVSIVSRLLPPGQPLTGSVYVASQDSNPFGSLLAMYIVATDPISGVVVKLAGEIEPDPNTGQLEAQFENMPQLPFEDAIMHLYGGEKAALSTPALCGTYQTVATMAPWSGGSDAAPSSGFAIAAGPHGSACPSVRPFAPSLAATPGSLQAGAFTSLSTTISRDDGNQDPRTLSLHLPPGFSGVLTGVKLCAEQAAEDGRCGSESAIGEAAVSAGVGNEPVTIAGGKVYLTGPYEGAPFGLSITSPAKAGPFDLAVEGGVAEKACDCIITRAKVEVDLHTATLTVTTDTPGAHHPIPRILAGVPLQLRRISVTANRPGFTFNPTNCSPLAVTGVATGYEGGSAPLSVPFQVANCATLKFTPKFTVSSTAKTSRLRGASLTAKVTEPTGALGSQANIAKVKVELPAQLPSRLTTLNKACLARVFETNPAGCPPQSIVGHAKVTTPVLPVPLTGPAYFVSHGNEAFPALTVVLQGYGITIQLVGSTLIRHGVTSTTFKTVPDVPFKTFELTLPQGRYSALGASLPANANGSLCRQNLKMPTEMVAQNGMVIHQSTAISITGCSKSKALAKRYAAALKACRKKHSKGRRASCVKTARNAYRKK
jgi:hypothetical protein